MAIPAVTCGADIEYTWASGAQTAALTAVATGSPTSWRWTILSVPVGLEALLVGVQGSFIDGVASVQNPSLPLPTNVAAGTIVLQCRATNGDGQSDPAVDRENGQQCVAVADANGRIFPGCLAKRTTTICEMHQARVRALRILGVI